MLEITQAFVTLGNDTKLKEVKDSCAEPGGLLTAGLWVSR